MKSSFLNRCLFASVLACLLLLPAYSFSHQYVAMKSVESDITPSQPFALWTNINDLLLSYAQARGIKGEEYQALVTMTPKVYTGKEPKDVFEFVGVFLHDFTEATGNSFSSHGDDVNNLENNVINVLSPKDGVVIPLMVFLRSTLAIDLVAQEFITLGIKDELLSDYFLIKKYENKTPSHVYALVELASRRLHMIHEITSQEMDSHDEVG